MSLSKTGMPKNHQLNRLVVGIALLFITAFSALSAQPKWANFTTDDIATDLKIVDGVVWYPTRGGLAKIELNTNETFVYNTANSNIPDNYIRDIEFAPDGTLWVLSNGILGTFSQGVFNTVNNIFSDSISLRYEGEIEFDSLGNLYISAKYYIDFNQFNIMVKIDENENISLFLDEPLEYRSFLVDEEERFWMVQDDNSVKMVENGDTTIFDENNSTIRSDATFFGIFVSPDNSIAVVQYIPYASYIDVHVNIFDGENWTEFVTASSGLPSIGIRNISIAFYDDLGTLWMTLRSGEIVKFDGANFELIPWPIDNEPTTTFYRRLMAVEDGKWWLHAWSQEHNRLVKYEQGELTHYSVSSANLSSNHIEAIHISENGEVVVLDQSGPSIYDGETWTNIPVEFTTGHSTKAKRDLQGNLWMSQYQNSFSFARHDGEDWTYIAGETVRDFFFDPDGNLWGIAPREVVFYDGENWTFFNQSNSDVSGFLWAMAPRDDGTFYFANVENELFIYDGTNISKLDLSLDPTETIYWIKEDNEGKLWIRHIDDMAIFDGNEYYIITDQFPSGSVNGFFDMVQDQNGIYWFATCDGLLRYDGTSWNQLLDGVSRGCLTTIEVDAFNNLWIGNLQQGVSVYNENGINTPGSSPVERCIQGKVYYDVNGNGVKDNEDYYLANQAVRLLPDNEIVYTSVFGDYRFDVEETFVEKVVEIVIDSNEWVLSSDTASYTVFIERECIDSLDFGLFSTQTDISATLEIVPGFPRCFQTTPFWISVRNEGYIPVNGKISLQIDEDVTFENAAPPPSDIIGNTYFWNVDSLSPFGLQTINLQLTYPGVDAIGDSVVFLAELIDDVGDVILDQTEVQQNIFCAYDPNDKTSFPSGPSVAEYTLIEDALEYLIRFENTGNDTAFRVVIRDTISPAFDINSLRVLASSHPVVTRVNGRLVEFIFDDILLLYSSIDSIRSQGFVKFSIQPNASTITDTEANNRAFIYFDFNPPIITNTTRNILVDELPFSAVEESYTPKQDCQLFFSPNPFTNYADIPIDDEFRGGTLSLYNSTGSKVFEQSKVDRSVRVYRRDLPSGVYFFALKARGNFCSGKLIVK